MRISRKQVITIILDKRIYGRNVKEYQDRLSRKLGLDLWTSRFSQMMQDLLDLILISREAQILVT